jgi:transposase
MAFMTSRKSGKKTYFYLARSVKKNGVSTQEILRSFGTIENIAKTFDKVESGILAETPTPGYCKIYQFGAVAALLDIASRLDIAGIIDKHVHKREQGLSVGTYMVLAAINRAVEPTSKNTFFEWFDRTVLPGIYPEATEHALSSQSFWCHMTALDQESICAIEDEITKRIVDYYDIATDCFMFDNTNFFTYIDTSNPAIIPQRGHSKEKRTDLKIIGLSLMVSPTHNIPFFHETYPGNRNDSKQFINIIDKLKSRLAKISDNTDNITLIFDKGNNSDHIVNMIDDGTILKLNFVGGLRLNQCPEILDLEMEQYTPLNGDVFYGASAFRLKKEIYGRDFTVVITDNPKLRSAQLDGLNANILKCEKDLKALQDCLKLRESGKIVKGRKRTSDSVCKNIRDILSAEHMKKVFQYTVTDTGNGISMSYNLDNNKYNYVINKYLGKTILFTNQDNWSNEQIVTAYRSQFHVEESFKTMKNIKYLSFRPVRHFTDRTITVHSFYCVLAYTLSCLLKLEMKDLGYTFSIPALLAELSGAKQSINFFIGDDSTKKKTVSVFSESSEAAKAYIERFDLKKYGL